MSNRSLTAATVLPAVAICAICLMAVLPVAGANDPPAGSQPICALSDAQQQLAPAAFDSLAAVVKGEARCNTCHGAADPASPRTAPPGGKIAASRAIATDTLQLCRQMKRSFESPASLLRHLKGDEATPAQLTPTAEAWVNAMGGRFTGNDECGCLPRALRHYSLSIHQNATVTFGGHYEPTPMIGMVTGHVDSSSQGNVPLSFRDDGSFSAELQMAATSKGVTQAPPLPGVPLQPPCPAEGLGTQILRIKGTVDDEHQLLHLMINSNSAGGKMTICGKAASMLKTSNKDYYPFDMPTTVGVEKEFPNPNKKATELTGVWKLRIDRIE
jgi:hypothetical protein